MRTAIWRLRVLLAVCGACITLATPQSASWASPDKTLIWIQSVAGEDTEHVKWPVAVASSSDREFAVADAFDQRLVVFRPSGGGWTLATSIELPGAPIGLTHTETGYVLSVRNANQLYLFEEPEYRRESFNLPSGVAAGPICAQMNGRLLVGDLRNQRIVEIDQDGGSILREAKVSETISAIACLSTGGFLAATPAKNALLHFEADWTQDSTWTLPNDNLIPAWPVGLAAEPGGDVFVVDRHTARVLILDATGALRGSGARPGWEPGLLRFPSGIARLGNGQIIVLDQGNERIQVFQSKG